MCMWRIVQNEPTRESAMQSTFDTTAIRDSGVPGSIVVTTGTALESSAATVGDVLACAVQDVSTLIPAERSVLFVYDKSVNLLKPQFVFNWSKSASVSQGTSSTSPSPSTAPHVSGIPADISTKEETAESGLQANVTSACPERISRGVSSSRSTLPGFPPVVGMISTCFLHKRCLRMQEPRQVRFSLTIGALHAT